ncbi:MAG: alpha/beta fold hydrolase [Planctomycetota bacterium]
MTFLRRPLHRSIFLGVLLVGPVLAQAITPAPPPAAPTEAVQFANGDVALAGSLLLPPGDGPFSGAILIHGSGTSARSNPWTSAYADALVRRGVAVLHPDKRGSGDSGGNWRTASFLDLADDAVAAVQWLRAHPRVDAANVGVIGFSQGGHIVPAAAARSPHVAFAVNVSGSVVPIDEQIRDEVVMMGERAGLTSSELVEVEAVLAAAENYARTGVGWSAYAEALSRARSGRMRGMEVVEGFASTPDDPAWEFLRVIGGFDPMEYWTQLEQPSLFLYGGQDTQLRIPKSIERIGDVLGPLNANTTVMLFNKNGHALYRDDALDFIATWIEVRGAH